mmetsp:Transcript_18267/g.33325  ORF Transcript_18267/g.33325 Transcript_18267/m.33325 type:complete len:261 (-) Transcript_18267:1585-2367(-)
MVPPISMPELVLALSSVSMSLPTPAPSPILAMTPTLLWSTVSSMSSSQVASSNVRDMPYIVLAPSLSSPSVPEFTASRLTLLLVSSSSLTPMSRFLKRGRSTPSMRATMTSGLLTLRNTSTLLRSPKTGVENPTALATSGLLSETSTAPCSMVAFMATPPIARARTVSSVCSMSVLPCPSLLNKPVDLDPPVPCRSWTFTPRRSISACLSSSAPRRRSSTWSPTSRRLRRPRNKGFRGKGYTNAVEKIIKFERGGGGEKL